MTPDRPAQRVALVDLLDRLLAGGVVISGDLTLSIADVDLVAVSLRVLISSVSELEAFDVPDVTDVRDLPEVPGRPGIRDVPAHRALEPPRDG